MVCSSRLARFKSLLPLQHCFLSTFPISPSQREEKTAEEIAVRATVFGMVCMFLSILLVL